MFIFALLIAVLLGYIFKGNLKNINAANIKGLYFAFSAIILETVIIRLIKSNYLQIGSFTFTSDLIMYTLLLIFVYLNRTNKWVMLIGFGLALNAVVIFSNGGVMPVNVGAVRALGFKGDITTLGLYSGIYKSTRFTFLADIFPMKYPKPGVASIGDFIEVVGLMLYIITEMKSKKTKTIDIKTEQ